MHHRTAAAPQAATLSRPGRSIVYNSPIYLNFNPWFGSRVLVKRLEYGAPGGEDQNDGPSWSQNSGPPGLFVEPEREIPDSCWTRRKRPKITMCDSGCYDWLPGFLPLLRMLAGLDAGSLRFLASPFWILLGI